MEAQVTCLVPATKTAQRTTGAKRAANKGLVRQWRNAGLLAVRNATPGPSEYRARRLHHHLTSLLAT